MRSKCSIVRCGVLICASARLSSAIKNQTGVVPDTCFAYSKKCFLEVIQWGVAMSRFRILILSVALVFVSIATAEAKTFRYAYRIDPASLDPHALAETFTLSWLGQVY